MLVKLLHAIVKKAVFMKIILKDVIMMINATLTAVMMILDVLAYLLSVTITTLVQMTLVMLKLAVYSLQENSIPLINVSNTIAILPVDSP
jgi:hypothetical protein